MDVVMNQIVNTYDIEKAKWQKDGVVDVQVKFEGKIWLLLILRT